jgi:hypothetical protein
MVRVRWNRWLGKLRRSAWVVAAAFLLCFLTDAAFGMSPVVLQIASGCLLVLSALLLAVDWWTAWLGKLDRVGLAQLLEKRHPDLAERLVTVVQMDGDQAASSFGRLLEAETEERLAEVDPADACPLDSERRAWGWTLGILLVTFVSLAYFTPLPTFAERLIAAWMPQSVGPGDDPTSQVAPRHPPTFGGVPKLIVQPPAYLNSGSVTFAFEEGLATKIEVLRYSKIRLELPLQRTSGQARLHLESNSKTVAVMPLQWHADGAGAAVDEIAEVPGEYKAVLVVQPESGKIAILPVGQWTVYDDAAPRFVQSLRLNRAGSVLSPGQDYRITPGVPVKLQTAVEDDEGLGAIAFEYRINDEAPKRVENWLDGGGKRELAIDAWLPLPSTLKDADRVQFRIHVSDNRRLKKGEVAKTPTRVVPAADLTPQTTTAPNGPGGGAAWITLRVERSADDFLAQQAKVQADEIRDLIVKIKQKVQTEAEQVEQLQRTVHRQTALTPAQAKQAEQLRALNREIAGDLLGAAEHLADNPELAILAGHFLDIREMEIKKSAQALERFAEKERALAEAEKELGVAQDALLEARKKLDRLLDWNKLLAQDRVDRFQLEMLAKRQEELAHRLEKLLAEERKDDAEAARQIEALRQEQGKLADQAAQMQEQNRLVQDSASAMQQQRMEQLAQEAEKLVAEQKAMREGPAAPLPAEIKERLDKLAQRQADLAQRVAKFAGTNEGPDSKPALSAADALKKPNIDEAIRQQQEHEMRLQQWAARLAPTSAGNPLRDLILQLAKKQQAVRTDLERLVKEVDKLDFDMLQRRLTDLTARQKELPAAIAKLPLDAGVERLRTAQKTVEKTTQRAADELARENAAGAPAAHVLMKQAEQELIALAALIPDAPPQKADVKDEATRAKIDAIQKFEQEQKELRLQTQKLLADAAKGGAGAGKNPLGEKTAKLASELMELAQKGGPEVKAMAKESAQALDAASKAMAAGAEMKAKGNTDDARKMDDNAEKALAFAVKQLKQNQDMKADPEKAKTAAALKEGQTQMRKAEANLPAMPKDAEAAMKSAAKSLAQASQAANKQSATRLPTPANTPPARTMPTAPGGGPPTLVKEMNLEVLSGKAWGELPGELKTRMLQDASARFGEDYAATIRQYFESLADTPRDRRKE